MLHGDKVKIMDIGHLFTFYIVDCKSLEPVSLDFFGFQPRSFKPNSKFTLIIGAFLDK